MKRSFVILFCILVAGAAYSQTLPERTPGPVLKWEESTYDFGDIAEGDKVEHVFKFTNTGTDALIITNVQVTCGCTTPKDWPRDPIQPGSKGEITVAFNSQGKKGKIAKVAVIISNAINPEGSEIRFTANVLEKVKSFGQK